MKLQSLESIFKKNYSKSRFIDLSNEILQIKEYEYIFDYIKHSPYLEELILPEISEDSFEKLVELLNNSTKKSIMLKIVTIDLPYNKRRFSKQISNSFMHINSRLSRNRQKIFGIHGGGNIGLCLMAYIASRSPIGFKIIATSSCSLTRNIINTSNKLYFHHKSEEDITVVNNIFMIGREKESVIQLYQESAIIAICVTSEVMQNIAKEVALGILKRYEKDESGLKILILMNKPNCHEFVYDLVIKEMLGITNNNKELTQIIFEQIEFIPTVIDRFVMKLPEDKIKNQIKTKLIKLNQENLKG